MQFKSQVGQDRWVCNILENKRNGYFIDVGACGGNVISNTWVLEKELGWSGICIEPAKIPFSQLVKERGCICINKAVYDRTGVITFHDYPEDLWRGHIDNVGYQIECITLRDLIKEYNCPRIIDYISIDVEGLEYEILTGFPFETHSGLLWTVEHNDDEKNIKRDKIRRLMDSNGYSFLPDDLRTEGWFEDWFYNKEYYELV